MPRRSHGSRARRLLGGLLAALLTGTLALAATEGVLRATREADRYYPYFPGSQRLLYPSEAITPGVSGVSRFTTNQYGCRGPEYDGQRVKILTVGGSTTACSVLDDEEEWPFLMMGELDRLADDPAYAWVTNSGIDGKNSHHHLMHALYLLPRLPHIDTMLVYAGLNDVGMWLYQGDFDPHFLDHQENWDSRVGESFRLSNDTPASYPWYKRLELWKRASVLKDRLLTEEAGEERRQGRIVQDAELNWMEEERARRNERAKILVPRAKMETLPAALDSYERCLRQIVEASRQNGTEPVFMAQAIQHQFLSEEERRRQWMGAMDGGATYVQESQMLELLQQYNARMRRVAADEGVVFIDLPALIEAEGEDQIFLDGVHFNEKGCRLVARLVADRLWQGLLHPSSGH